MLSISQIQALQIFDSRGNPTVRCRVVLSDGSLGVASVPSGASTGQHEALERRDGGMAYGGKGVQAVCQSLEGEIADALIGLSPEEISRVDATLLMLDGTEDKSRLGANALLAASLATARAWSHSAEEPLMLSVARWAGVPFDDPALPLPMLNVLNGGAHANNDLSIQEFMILPTGAQSFSESLQWSSEVYHTLKSLLASQGLSTAVGDEGGFAPTLPSNAAALDLLEEAIEKAGYTGRFHLGLDVAATEFLSPEGMYEVESQSLSSGELMQWYEGLLSGRPLYTIEDPFGEDDWEAWSFFCAEHGDSFQIVGDDLYVTNPDRLQQGIAQKSSNAILIKPNQIGTLSETINAVKLAHEAGMNTVMSHRSGETEDTTIADLAVGLGCSQIKTGAPSRGERTAKYNRLLEIEAGW